MITTTHPLHPHGHIHLRHPYRAHKSDQRDYEALQQIALTALICFNVALYAAILIWWII